MLKSLSYNNIEKSYKSIKNKELLMYPNISIQNIFEESPAQNIE